MAGSALDAALDATVGRAVVWTWARQRQHVSASAWLMAPHVEQMVSRMLMQEVSAERGPELSPARGIPPDVARR